jgi:hypothetical protein
LHVSLGFTQPQLAFSTRPAVIPRPLENELLLIFFSYLLVELPDLPPPLSTDVRWLAPPLTFFSLLFTAA